MSKKYIGFEEPIYENQNGPSRHLRQVVRPLLEQREGSTLLNILGAIVGVTIRLGMYTVITLWSLLFYLSENLSWVDIIIGSLITFYWLSMTFYWMENRISAWMISHYIRKREFKKIWASDMLHSFVIRNRNLFITNGNIPRLDLSNAVDIPETEIQWSHNKGEHELKYMVLVFLESLVFARVTRSEGIYVSKSIRTYAWNIVFAIVLVAVLGIDLYASFFCDWPLWIRLIGGLYLALHLSISIPRFILRLVKEFYGISYMDSDSFRQGREKYQNYKKSSYMRFFEGRPVNLYFPQNRRIENDGYGDGYSLRAYCYPAPVRFLIYILRLIIIV